MGAIVPTINSFEGGTDGVTITEALSGGMSGDGFNTVSVGTGATMQFSSTHAAHGVLSMKVATGATPVTPFVAWNSSRLGKLTASYIRFYLYMTALPAANHRLFTAVGAGLSRAGILITTTGHLRTLDAAGGTIDEFSNSIALNQWIRVEAKIVGDPSVGQMEIKYFNTFDSTTPTDTKTSAANKNTGGYVDTWRFGVTSNAASVNAFWMDEIGVDADAYPGVFDPTSATIFDNNIFSDTRPIEKGVPDSCVLFDGATQYVDLGNNAAYSIATTHELTIVALVRPDSLYMTQAEGAAPRDYVHYMGKGDTYGVSGNQEYTFRMYQRGNSENRANRCSCYAFNPSGGLGNGSYFQDDLLPGGWFMVTGAWDATTVRIFKDGLPRDNDLLDQSPTGGPNIVPTAGSAHFRVGSRDGASYFQGSVARVAMWSRRLTDGEIANLQTARLAGTYDTQVLTTLATGLVAFWKLNEADGATVAVDSSGNGHHGTYANAVTAEQTGYLDSEMLGASTALTRLHFGDAVQDFSVGVGASNTAILQGGTTVTFYNARTGGTQWTDLLDMSGGAISSVTTSDGTDGRAVGSIPMFQGPDGVFELWAQAGSGPRQLMTASNLGSFVAARYLDLGIPYRWIKDGTAATGQVSGRYYNNTGADLEIVAVWASAGTAPTGTSLVVDVQKGGTTIFTTTANRPTIAAGTNSSGRVTNADITAWPAGTYLTTSITQVGSTVAGSNVVVEVLAVRAVA